VSGAAGMSLECNDTLSQARLEGGSAHKFFSQLQVTSSYFKFFYISAGFGGLGFFSCTLAELFS
jgi:hypothetical protein